MTTGSDTTGGASADAETAHTLAKLHAGNQAEIEAGNWMKDRAQSSKVKDFAQKMVDDHGSMDKDVQSFAQKRGIDLTAGASSTASAEKGKAEHQLDEIKAMTGAQADRAYMDMMVRDHQKDVSATRQAEQTAKSNKDDEFAKLLDNSAKKMESHLKDAQKIDRELTQRQARTPSSQ
jgi:putative membrane protein